MNNLYVNRRTLVFGAGLAAGLASVRAGPARAGVKEPRFVINALGGLGNPNRGPLSAEDIAAHKLDARAIADAREARLAAINVTLGHVFGDGDPFVNTIDDIAWYDAAIRKHEDALIKVLSTADIETARKKKKAGIIYGFQNSEMFGGDASRARLFADLGVRVVQLTYNLKGTAGDGALVQTEEGAEDGGLTEFGHDLVAALNEKRMLVDLSHASEKTTFDAIAASEKPIAITHTGCAAMAPHPRNKTNEELRAVAEKGGVVGIYFMPYLTPGRQQKANDIVRHIEHAIEKCGEDHVGVGTDGGVTGVDDMETFLAAHRADIENRKKLGIGAPNEDPDIVTIPPDLMGPNQFVRLAERLAARGHGSARIDKIMGENFMRLFGEVW